MSPTSFPAPREFGAQLKSAREAASIDLETIIDRTKIARSVLEALEAGEFAKLPNRVFIRLFLRQYLAIIGEDPRRWNPRFEGAWDRFERATQPIPTLPVSSSRSRRWLPWLIGVLVVAVALVAVFVVERRQDRRDGESVPPTPEMRLPQPTPTVPPATPPDSDTPVPSPTSFPGQPEADEALSPAPAATASALVGTPPVAPPAPAGQAAAQNTAGSRDGQVLVIRATTRSCWVEVTVAGFAPVARLLEVGAALRIPAGGREVSLTVGDAGAAAVEYLGEIRDPIGEDGQVVHLTLGPARAAQGRQT